MRILTAEVDFDNSAAPVAVEPLSKAMDFTAPQVSETCTDRLRGVYLEGKGFTG